MQPTLAHSVAKALMGPPRKIPARVRQRLQRAIVRHASGTHIKYSDLSVMSDDDVLALATRLKIDDPFLESDDEKPTIQPLTAKEKAQLRYLDKHPAFRGCYEFDLTMEALGQRFTRRIRVDYTHTPEWEHFDLDLSALHTGWSGSRYGLSILTVPDDADDKPQWVRLEDIIENDVLPQSFWHALDDEIDRICREEDQQRRKSAGLA